MSSVTTLSSRSGDPVAPPPLPYTGPMMTPIYMRGLALSGPAATHELCLDCMAAFIGSLPPKPVLGEQTPSRLDWAPPGVNPVGIWDELSRHPGYLAAVEVHRPAAEKYAREVEQWKTQVVLGLNTWPRCQACQPITKDHDLIEFPPVSYQKGDPLCARCRIKAREEVVERFPHLISVSCELNPTPLEDAAWWVAMAGSARSAVARDNFLKAWRLCEACPGTPAPPKPKGAAELESRIVAALSANDGPMSTSDLVARKFKGLTNNSAKRVMEDLRDAGKVTMHARGPAKFWEVAS